MGESEQCLLSPDCNRSNLKLFIYGGTVSIILFAVDVRPVAVVMLTAFITARLSSPVLQRSFHHSRYSRFLFFTSSKFLFPTQARARVAWRYANARRQRQRQRWGIAR
jgi:hypothetical protein